MSSIGNSIKSAFGGESDASKSVRHATERQAEWQQRGLDYLMESEELPQQFREGALTQLGGMYGLEGGEGSQQELIDRAKGSPLYSAIMGGREAGEESILRNASATGGLRSGGVQANLYDYNAQLQNLALRSSYGEQMQGLQGLARLPSNANAIANQYSNIGQTIGQGTAARGQAQINAEKGGSDLLMGMFSGGLDMFSDRRLKKDVKKIGKRNGLNIYTWAWNKFAEDLGLVGKSVGYIADEVKKKYPGAVSTHDSGFMVVNYEKIGV